MSGRRRPTVAEIARLLGQDSYIYEVGCGLVVDGEETLLTGNLQPREGKTVFELIAESGAPRLLLDRYPGRLEYHAPWHGEREFTHLMRGLVDAPRRTRCWPSTGTATCASWTTGRSRPSRRSPTSTGRRTPTT